MYRRGPAKKIPERLQGRFTRSQRNSWSNLWSSYLATCLMAMRRGIVTKMNHEKNWMIIIERPTTSTNGFIGMPKMHGGLVAPLKI